MTSRLLALTALVGLGLLALAAGSARAQEPDPPGRAARLGYVEGSVSLEPAGTSEWTSAERNRPLTTGDRLWTDQSAVAEIDLGSAVLRLGAMTGFAFLNLDDTHAQLQLSTGVLIVHVWDMSQGQNYEIDTPNLAFTLQQPGVYRLEVDETGGTTTIKVSEGEALAIGSDQSIPITIQQVMTFTGTTTLSYSAATLGAPDDFDEWSASRDRGEQDSPSAQYVADDTPGRAALDDNGRWVDTPEYGTVWTPVVVVAGWVPYRFGHWLWVAPWGWTWVDDAPWGYAPFHYGRWVHWSGSWCWVPNPRRVRPVYAPALVAWTGGLPAPPGSVARHIGWLPLGPREVYAPGYPVSNAYLLRVNRANTTVASEAYVTSVYEKRATNIHYVNSTSAGVTAVPETVFTSGQEAATHHTPLAAGALGGLTVAAAAPAIAPVRQSVSGAGSRSKVTRPPPGIANRPVVAHTAPPRAPVAFDRQVAAIQANGGRPLAPGELGRLEPGKPTAEVHMLTANKVTSRPQPQPQPSLGERARALENPMLAPATAPATTTRTFVRDSTPAAQPAPASRADRPPWAPQRSVPAEDTTRPVTQPSMSVYHTDPPPAPVEARPAPVEYSTDRPSRAPTSSSPSPARAQAPPNYTRPPQQTQRTESHPAANKESRQDSSPKGDRAKERVEK